jgi:hypothetical protein
MPFPLAHPAAVLPLRRFCPRYLNFPALIVGSLSPDAGYAFGSLHLYHFSHRPLAGTFGFCLPVGLVAVLGFYLVRLPVVRLLPECHQRTFLPLCQRPVGSPFLIPISLVLGALTHELLDALTHPEYWLVRYLPVLLAQVPTAGMPGLRVCDVLYTGCTFAGVAWLALVYLRWLGQNTGAAIPQGMRWGCALLLAGAILFLALACRGSNQLITLTTAGILSIVLVIGFFLATGWLVRSPPSEAP